jgi:formylglycine-generating enzyme required for sulfatase activity
VWQRPPPEALGLLGEVSAFDDDDDNKQFAERLRRELERPQTILTGAYKAALEAKMRSDGSVEMLLAEFKDLERPLARRAIRSALGELDVMVQIPAGTFIMGAREIEQGGHSYYNHASSGDERPQHSVRVAAFEIGKYPVTFDEFDAFCEATNYYRRETGRDRPDDQGGRGNRPVTNVSWNDAKAYIDWLNSWSGGGYRLPSEAEWEYACRAGTATRWSFGDLGDPGEYAWWGGSSSSVDEDGVETPDSTRENAQPVGEKQPNGFGLYDMHGNVWEWCEDPWHDTYEGAPDDGSAWNTRADNSKRVLRGGSWLSDELDLRSSRRVGDLPTFRTDDIGFRVAKTIPL